MREENELEKNENKSKDGAVQHSFMISCFHFIRCFNVYRKFIID